MIKMKICEEQCGKDAECVYEVCPFEHEYTEKDEVVSGYRYIGDPAYNKKIEWAKDFQKNHNCNSCPFIKNEVDIGAGMLRDCDLVCQMEIGEILEEMKGACV
jgi:hypothetical protein